MALSVSNSCVGVAPLIGKLGSLDRVPLNLIRGAREPWKSRTSSWPLGSISPPNSLQPWSCSTPALDGITPTRNAALNERTTQNRKARFAYYTAYISAHHARVICVPLPKISLERGIPLQPYHPIMPLCGDEKYKDTQIQ